MEEQDYAGSYEVDLSEFDEGYEDIPVEKKEFDPIPDGKYQVVVDKVELGRSQQMGNPMLTWTLKVIAPDNIGRLLWRRNMLMTADNIKWLKQDLVTCGLELKKLSDLSERLDDLLDIKLEITKKTKGEYENIYLNRRIDIDTDETYKPDNTPF